nr:hypothetical protein [Xylella taiwanensis]
MAISRPYRYRLRCVAKTFCIGCAKVGVSAAFAFGMCEEAGWGVVSEGGVAIPVSSNGALLVDAVAVGGGTIVSGEI